MTLGKLPFENEQRSALVEQVVSQEPVIPPDTPAMIADLLSRMLKKSADQRITIEEMSQHPWLRNSVWHIYFDKAFQAFSATCEDDQEAAAIIRKWGLDPERLFVSGTEEEMVRKMLKRRKQNQIAAHPEMTISGSRRIGVAPAPSWPGQEASARPTRVSVLDNIQQQTGFVVTRTMSGQGRQGRRLMRPLRRVRPMVTMSGLFQDSAPELDDGH
jgi:serine/threonine protein kinase